MAQEHEGQMQRRGGPSRSTASEKVNAKGPSDMNKERLIFVLTSLVGQRVTARLRDNEIYEGLFHGFSPDPDFAITLKSARRLASQRDKSGKVHEALIISGKDFLAVSASDVPSTTSWDNQQSVQNSGSGFRTDGEISQSKGAGQERELVAWSGEGQELAVQTLEESRYNDDGSWDQFAVNQEQFGVTTTFNEELYTTKLDPNRIPIDVREKAERLAREIEAGQMSADVENNIDGEDDEEGRFSAVHGTGAYNAKKPGQSSEALVAGSSSTASPKARGKGPLPTIPLPPEDRQRQDELGGLSDARAKRMAANSPTMMKTSMISEMKRINALNLEPAVPKLDDKADQPWLNFQQSQSRTPQKSSAGANDLKMNFQQSLDLIQRREAAKQQGQQAKLQQEQQRNQDNASSDNWRNAKGGNQLSLPQGAMAQGEIQRTVSGGGGDSTRSKFTFNAGAASFTPSNANSGPGTGGMIPSGNMQQSAGGHMAATSKATAPSPPFNTFPTNNALLEKKLETLLDSFYESFNVEALGQLEPQWNEAQGPSYKDVLGQPVPPPGPIGNMGAPQPMAMGAPWQQQQQQQMGQGPPGGPPQGQGGNAPQMMQQPVMFQAPGGQNQAMFQPMFQPGPNASMPPQRPQNAGNMPPPQDQQMGDGNPHSMDFYMKAKQQPQGGQFMVSPPGGQPQGGGMMMMMVPGQGGAMPKYGQVMMAPAGQFPQFPQGGGQPGGPGPGGPGGNQHGGQWQVANAHMVPAHMMQQVGGPRGPPHQMGGHDG